MAERTPLLSLSAGELAAEAERRRRNRAAGRPLEGDDAPAVLPHPAALEQELERVHELEGDRVMRSLGFDVIRFSRPGRTGQTEGIPDRRYYHRRRRLVFWWEAKAATGRQRPEQCEFQRMCEAVGDPYVLGTFDDLCAHLVAAGIAERDGSILIPTEIPPR